MDVFARVALFFFNDPAPAEICPLPLHHALPLLLDLAAATPITVGTAVLGTLDPASETDLYRFDATVGERDFFDVQARSGAPSARWRVLDPFSNPVVPERDFNSTGSDSGPVTLSLAGAEPVLVEGALLRT